MKDKIKTVRKVIPPLRDVPDEIQIDSGEDSDFKVTKIEAITKFK